MAYLDKSIIKADPKLENKSNYLTFVEQSNGMLELKTDSGMLYNPVTETLIIQNLSVNGTTTTVNTETINLADNIITLNSNIGEAIAPTEDGGIEIKRGSSPTVVLRWNEADDRWEFTNNGTLYNKLLIDGEYVKSVGLALPTSVFSISSSPVTNAGTLTGAFISQTKNTVFAAPNGSNGVPTFRALVDDDLPTASVTAPGTVSIVAQEFKGNKTFRAAATQDGITLAGRAGGTSSHSITLIPDTLSANQTITLPNKTGTVALLTDIAGGTANKVANPLTIKFDTGTTENTNLYTFDGSNTKTIDIKAGTNVSLTKAANSITINSIDTTYLPGLGLDLDIPTSTFSVDLSELTTSTTDSHGAYFIVTAGSNDGSAQYKLQKSSIKLSGFNNDSNWTSNTGTVTSVGGTGTVSGLTLTGTVTTSGNLTLGGTLVVTPSNFSSQTANTFLAAPATGSGVPTFRKIVAEDLPTISTGTLTGVLPIDKGGTGVSATVQGGVVYGASATAYGTTAAGVSKQVLISNGTSAPSWVELDMTYIPGASFKKSVLCATTGNLASTYASNVLTMSAAGVLTIDGIATKLNDRILVKDQTTASQNGIYYVSTEGTASVAAKLTRALDADIIAEIASSQVAVDSGTVNGGFLFETDIKTTDTLGTTNMYWNAAADSGKKLSFFAPTTSLELAGVISDETGTGTLVFNTSPTITTPTINVIKASAAGITSTLWSEITTGSITIGAGLTSGALNLGTGGTGATPITIGNVNSTTTILGNAVLPSGSTKIGNTTITQGINGSITLPPATGTLYTGSVAPVAGGVIYGSSTTQYGSTAAGSSGQILKSNGASAPTWVNPNSLSAGSVSGTLTVKFDGGTTENTDKYTYNGSADKTFDIKAGQGIALTKTTGVITISNTESMIVKTTAYTPTATDSIILCDSTSGTFKITLPTTAPSGTVYRIKKIDSSTNIVTIDATAGKTIDGAQTFDLNYQYQAIDVVFNGSSIWYIL